MGSREETGQLAPPVEVPSSKGSSSNTNNKDSTNNRMDQERCACCNHVLHSGDVTMETTQHREPEGPNRSPITSRMCGHTICVECVLNAHLQEEAKSEHGSQTSLPWMDCPVCHSSFAFNADQLGEDTAPAHYTRKVSAQSPPSRAYSVHPPHYHHHHYPPSTPYYSGGHSTTAYVTPAREPYSHRPVHSWQPMDYSPPQHRYAAPPVPRDFHPPPPPPSFPGLSPPDIRRPSTQLPPSSHSPMSTSSPVRKRLRVPISRSTAASKAIARESSMSEDQESTTSRTAPSPTTSSAKQWLTCRICSRPVVVTCQRLLSGPPPDHESLWPQVRLGKRLAAALRQHNQQHHPEVFMWNVKGRSVMSCSSEDMDDDDAVAQAALLKSLEASFEHLPHVSGVDSYESKSAFLSRTLRRIGYAYAYINYTSSEWTKWQQWKKECYSRVHIQAKARQLLEKYEVSVKEAIDDQWPQISSFDHQEKLDLFQNIFVLPQCIFECLNHGRLPMHYGNVTGADSV